MLMLKVMDAEHDHYRRLKIDAPSQGTTANIRIYFIFQETRIVCLHFAR